MGKHSPPKSGVLLAVQQYEQLVTVLYHHRPGTRSGLCLACGIGWPCVEVWLPFVVRTDER